MGDRFVRTDTEVFQRAPLYSRTTQKESARGAVSTLAAIDSAIIPQSSNTEKELPSDPAILEARTAWWVKSPRGPRWPERSGQRGRLGNPFMKPLIAFDFVPLGPHQKSNAIKGKTRAARATWEFSAQRCLPGKHQE
eukprot:gene23341-biopygen2026